MDTKDIGALERNVIEAARDFARAERIYERERTQESARMVSDCRKVLGACTERLNVALAPPKDPTPEDRVECLMRSASVAGWTFVPFREITLGEIRSAERRADKRAITRACEYVASYEMALPVRMKSDVEAWKRGLIQSLEESGPKEPL